jgi:hypothetical protein
VVGSRVRKLQLIIGASIVNRTPTISPSQRPLVEIVPRLLGSQSDEPYRA